MHWKNFRNRLVRRTIDLLWSQWGALGIQSTRDEQPVMVDLEAMLLGTWTFGRTEPRLFDEALSWCCRSGGLVNFKRLEKLLNEVEETSIRRLATAWGQTVEEHGEADWKLKSGAPTTADSSSPLFMDESFLEQSVGPTRDPIFEDNGFLRGPFEPGRIHRKPQLGTPAALQLFCRKLVGGGYRAEILWLLTYGSKLTTAELSAMSLYSRRSVQQVLGDLKAIGVVDWNPGRGRRTQASIRSKFQSGFLSGLDGSSRNINLEGVFTQRDWPDFYLGLVPLWKAARRISQSDYDGFKAQSLLRDALEDAYQYHSKTTIYAVYQPTLTVTSFDELVSEADLYLHGLMPE